MNLQVNQAVTERSSEFYCVSGAVVVCHWWQFYLFGDAGTGSLPPFIIRKLVRNDRVVCGGSARLRESC